MKSWGKLVGCGALSLGIALGFTTSVNSKNTIAEASTWHRGHPRNVYGSYRTKKFYAAGHPDQEHFFIWNKGFDIIQTNGCGSGVTNGIWYRYLGHHKYQLKERFTAGPNDYGYQTIKVSHNGHKIFAYKQLGKMFYKISNKSGIY